MVKLSNSGIKRVSMKRYLVVSNQGVSSGLPPKGHKPTALCRIFTLKCNFLRIYDITILYGNIYISM